MFQQTINDFYFRNYNPYGINFNNHNMQNVQCRFVTNIDEAKAALIDPLSTNIYLDAGNGKIYLKKLGNNGLSEFLSYVVEETNNETKTTDPLLEIKERLIKIEKSIGELNNDKSISSNECNEKSADVYGNSITEQNKTDVFTES